MSVIGAMRPSLSYQGIFVADSSIAGRSAITRPTTCWRSDTGGAGDRDRTNRLGIILLASHTSGRLLTYSAVVTLYLTYIGFAGEFYFYGPRPLFIPFCQSFSAALC